MPERPVAVPADAVWSEPDQEWVLGGPDGMVAYYRPDGTLCNLCPRVDDRPHGLSRRYHEFGGVSVEAMYDNGLQHGLTTATRPDPAAGHTTERQMANLGDAVHRWEADWERGQIRSMRYYGVDGTPLTSTGDPLPPRPPDVPDSAMYTGRYEEWRDTAYSATGDPVGLRRRWTREGRLVAEERHGETDEGTLYYDNGQPKISYVLRDERPDGTLRTWRPDGTPLLVAEYANGIRRSAGALEPAPPARPSVDLHDADRTLVDDIAAGHDADGRILTPRGLAAAIAGGWFHDADDRPPAARALRRHVLATAPPSVAAHLAGLGLDRAPRVMTSARMWRLLDALRPDPAVDADTLLAAVATAGSIGAAALLSRPEWAAGELERRTTGRALNLSRMNLTELPDAVGTLGWLAYVDLTGNRLTRLPAALGDLPMLQTLTLRQNRIEALPATLAGLRLLTDVALSRNELTRWPDGLAELDQLADLDLTGNQITELPDTIAGLAGLTRMWLSDNPLTGLPDAFAALDRLEFLHLGGVPWDEPPAVLARMPALRELWIGTPTLRRLPPDICRLPNLTTLVLWDSALTEVPEELFAMTGLRELRIKGNPLPDGTLARIAEALPDCVIY